MSFGDALAGKRIFVCVGPGGVGKTTTSAALGLGFAARGQKVAVVTIDPAKRLADALGLDGLDNEPRRVEAKSVPGVELRGELWAMTLDPKQTFDELIDEVSSDVGQADAIKRNHIYREISKAIAGSQEYTAIAKLHELALSERFDVLVLDTPPAQNALDFLDAPGRLTTFLEGRALQALLAPTGFGARLLSPVLGALQRITGVDVIAELIEFFALIGPLSLEFSARAHAVDDLLHSAESAFLIVTRPAHSPIDDALALNHALRERALPLRGVIVNRLVEAVAVGGTASDGVAVGGAAVDGAAVDGVANDRAAVAQALQRDLGPALTDRVLAAVADQNSLAAQALTELDRLRQAVGDRPLQLIGQFDDDVHDTTGLVRIADRLFGDRAFL